jgi:hypothetical protein
LKRLSNALRFLVFFPTNHLLDRSIHGEAQEDMVASASVTALSWKELAVHFSHSRVLLHVIRRLTPGSGKRLLVIGVVINGRGGGVEQP